MIGASRTGGVVLGEQLRTEGGAGAAEAKGSEGAAHGTRPGAPYEPTLVVIVKAGAVPAVDEDAKISTALQQWLREEQ